MTQTAPCSQRQLSRSDWNKDQPEHRSTGTPIDWNAERLECRWGRLPYPPGDGLAAEMFWSCNSDDGAPSPISAPP